MATLFIKLFPETYFDQRVLLEGRPWLLDFVFEDRLGYFTMSVYDNQGREIVLGDPLAPGALKSYGPFGGPPGIFALATQGSIDSGYTRAQIRAGEVVLMYITSEDPEEFGA